MKTKPNAGGAESEVISMFDLYRVFLNPFDDEEISIDEVLSYTPAHLAALIANNPAGQFDALIAATDTVLGALGGTVTDETVKLGIQKARTQAKEHFRAALSNDLSKVHGAALAKYGRKGATMLEIFPGGLDAFRTATDDTLAKKLDALAEAVGQHPEMGADAKTQAEALAATWEGLYGAAKTGKAGSGSAADQRRAASRALRLQLFRNLLALAAAFPGQREKASLYCPQHLLENAVPAKKPAAGGAAKA
jgi:hypothetical protein